MELKIKRDSNLTIHIQLKEQIKGFILNNVLENGMQLPTVRQLGEFLRINKNTVSKVYKELEEQGYVYSVKGRGTFVSKTEKPKRTKEFMKMVEEVLKKGMDFGLSLEEIWGIVYSKSQHFKYLELKQKSRKIVFIECNNNSIDEFKKLVKKYINELEVEAVLIDDLKNNFTKIKKDIEQTSLIVIPYIHYQEVKEDLKKLNKEIITIGANQSLKILTYSKKLKNKNVGVIGFTEEDEYAIAKQFNKIEIKKFVYYGGINKSGEEGLKDLFRNVDVLIVCSTVIENVIKDMKPKKPYVIFEGKYDKNDINLLKEIYE